MHDAHFYLTDLSDETKYIPLGEWMNDAVMAQK